MTVNQIIQKLKSGQLDNPSELADYLVQLSASLNQGGNLELEAEIKYAKEWREIKSMSNFSDKRTDMEAKLTDAYKEWQEMRIANKTILETIRALKKKLANLNTEYQEGQNY